MSDDDQMSRPAYPITTAGPGGETTAINHGSTKLDYFAARAPQEIPDFFQVYYDPYCGIPAPVLPPDTTAEDKELFNSWVRDGIFDLPEHLHIYGEQQIKHRHEMARYNTYRIRYRYFMWRWYYAQTMLNLRPDEGEPVDVDD